MRFVVIIDKRDCAGDFTGISFLPVFDELRADHVGDGQRTIIIAFLGSHFIELFSKVGGRDTLKRVAVSFFMAAISRIVGPGRKF